MIRKLAAFAAAAFAFARAGVVPEAAAQVFGQAGGQQIGRIQTFKGYQPLYQGQARTVTLGAVQLHDVPIGLVPDSQVSVLGLDWLALVGPVTLVS